MWVRVRKLNNFAFSVQSLLKWYLVEPIEHQNTRMLKSVCKIIKDSLPRSSYRKFGDEEVAEGG